MTRVDEQEREEGEEGWRMAERSVTNHGTGGVVPTQESRIPTKSSLECE